MENGDISGFSKKMYDAFDRRNKKTLVTPELLNRVIGKEMIDLNNYDIYAMGKKKGNKSKYYWTKLRIVGREFERNILQGYLSVVFLAGYGFQRVGCKSDAQLMRPTDIGNLVSDDNSVFKKRAMIDIGNGHFMSLEHSESFCRVPLLSSEDIDRHTNEKKIKDTKLNCKKRKAYASGQLVKKKWAHINRRTMERDQKKSLHKMLLPYKKNMSDDVYFSEFMKDVTKNCKQLKEEFKFAKPIQKEMLNLEETGNEKETETKSEDSKYDVVKLEHRRKLSGIPICTIEW